MAQRRAAAQHQQQQQHQPQQPTAVALPSSWTTTAGGEEDDAPASAPAPPTCIASSTVGCYAPATLAGAPCLSGVLLVVNATTYYGEDILIVGNTTDLGSWDLASALPLRASNYTTRRPVWFAEVALSAGHPVAYKYVRREDCGQPPLWGDGGAHAGRARVRRWQWQRAARCRF